MTIWAVSGPYSGPSSSLCSSQSATLGCPLSPKCPVHSVALSRPPPAVPHFLFTSEWSGSPSLLPPTLKPLLTPQTEPHNPTHKVVL